MQAQHVHGHGRQQQPHHQAKERPGQRTVAQAVGHLGDQRGQGSAEHGHQDVALEGTPGDPAKDGHPDDDGPDVERRFAKEAEPGHGKDGGDGRAREQDAVEAYQQEPGQPHQPRVDHSRADPADLHIVAEQNAGALQDAEASRQDGVHRLGRQAKDDQCQHVRSQKDEPVALRQVAFLHGHDLSHCTGSQNGGWNIGCLIGFSSGQD